METNLAWMTVISVPPSLRPLRCTSQASASSLQVSMCPSTISPSLAACIPRPIREPDHSKPRRFHTGRDKMIPELTPVPSLPWLCPTSWLYRVPTLADDNGLSLSYLRLSAESNNMFRKRRLTASGTSGSNVDQGRCKLFRHLPWGQPSDHLGSPSKEAESRGCCKDSPGHCERVR